MAQFDVYQNSDPASRETIPFLLDVQHNLHQSLTTHTVVPLLRSQILSQSMPKLCPILAVDGVNYIMSTPELAGYPMRDFGPKITSLSEDRLTILNAIDFLLTGF
jgi:toxin CcdB